MLQVSRGKLSVVPLFLLFNSNQVGIRTKQKQLIFSVLRLTFLKFTIKKVVEILLLLHISAQLKDSNLGFIQAENYFATDGTIFIESDFYYIAILRTDLLTTAVNVASIALNGADSTKFTIITSLNNRGNSLISDGKNLLQRLNDSLVLFAMFLNKHI